MALLSPSRATGDIAPTDPLHDPNAGAARTKAPPRTVKPAILNLVEQSLGVNIPETFKAVSAERWPMAGRVNDARASPASASSTWRYALAGVCRSTASCAIPAPWQARCVQFHAAAASARVLLRVSLAVVGRDEAAICSGVTAMRVNRMSAPISRGLVSPRTPGAA